MPAWAPLKLMAGKPMPCKAMASRVLATTSPVERRTSSSRLSGNSLIW